MIPRKKQGNGSKHCKSGTEYFCTEHGKNPTHATADCYTIKNRIKVADGDNTTGSNTTNCSFSAKKFRKEVHAMAHGKDKRKVLELYSAEIKREKAKMNAKSSHKKVSTHSATVIATPVFTSWRKLLRRKRLLGVTQMPR